MDNKLPKKMRLQKGHEFRYLKNNSMQIMGRYIILSYAKSTDNQLRVGVITSKKYDNKATERNRARRLIKESFRQLSNQINHPVWLVFIARKFLHKKKLIDVKTEMQALLHKANFS